MAAPEKTPTSPDAHRALPDKKAVEAAGELLIKDEKGNEIAFKSLYSDKPADERQLIVFVRHFFCGSCELYAQALARDLPVEALAANKITLTIIGCGEPICIADWRKRTGCPYPPHTEPKHRLQDTLGPPNPPRAMPDKFPEYHSKSLFQVIKDSTWHALSSGPKKALSGGPASQQGGEWLFQNGEVKFVHRMRNSADHVDTKELKMVLEINE
ncbi:uncharacterized protein RCC_08491 [Ramularia collo-cygni]|uniref:Thioredoxin-like protein n=1 Tax=Ramularia collo-cygni TaxID=112498 RepID=A0A2D3VAW4_9PEZI|nr:uncharacterized protein RCC_08491 [Ramularia collo-cygni]CZT22785.1 uncharacterized protein RCC_08491 [Ramularia collo-cygni]